VLSSRVVPSGATDVRDRRPVEQASPEHPLMGPVKESQEERQHEVTSYLVWYQQHEHPQRAG